MLCYNRKGTTVKNQYKLKTKKNGTVLHLSAAIAEPANGKRPAGHPASQEEVKRFTSFPSAWQQSCRTNYFKQLKI